MCELKKNHAVLVRFGPCSLGSVRQGRDPECTDVPRCPGCWCLALARWEASGKVGTPSVLLYLGVQADGRIRAGRSGAGRWKQRMEAFVNIHSNVTFPGCDICIEIHVESWDRLFLVGACVRNIMLP